MVNHINLTLSLCLHISHSTFLPFKVKDAETVSYFGL